MAIGNDRFVSTIYFTHVLSTLCKEYFPECRNTQQRHKRNCIRCFRSFIHVIMSFHFSQQQKKDFSKSYMFMTAAGSFVMFHKKAYTFWFPSMNLLIWSNVPEIFLGLSYTTFAKFSIIDFILTIVESPLSNHSQCLLELWQDYQLLCGLHRFDFHRIWT